MSKNTPEPVATAADDAADYTVLLFLAKDKLQEAKPNDRSERDRHYAVALTDIEKLIAYCSLYL